MKLKKILLVVGVTCGVFLSCTSESIIDEPVIESQELSIILTTSNNLSTKATIEEVPSPDEKNIDDCHVAIFDANGKRIYSKNFSGMGDPAVDSKYALNLGLVRTFGKEEKNIQVYILANAGDYSMFDNCENYIAYQENGIVLTDEFKATKLVKAGLVSETLKYDSDNLANNVKEITVPLTLLSARVDFLGVEIEGQSEASEDWSEPSGYIIVEPGEWPQAYSQQAKSDKCYNEKSDGYYNFPYYATKRVLLLKQTRTQAGGYSISSSFVGINKRTLVTIYDNKTKENTTKSLSTEPTPLKSHSFYTYEDGNINIHLDVNFASSNEKTQVRYAYVIQEKERKERKWPAIQENGLKWSEWESISSSGEDGAQKSYTLDLSSERFVKGNIYQIKGKINPALPSEIKWEVIPIPWNETPVNIPGFN